MLCRPHDENIANEAMLRIMQTEVINEGCHPPNSARTAL
jgi:hypothetical protein